MLERSDKPAQKPNDVTTVNDEALKALIQFADATTTTPADREEALRTIAGQFPHAEGPDEAE